MWAKPPYVSSTVDTSEDLVTTNLGSWHTEIMALAAPLPDTGSPENEGGIGTFRTLMPGETFTKEVNITDWFKFEDPGWYRVTCFYRLELIQDGAKYPLWDEFAVGECLVRIEDSIKKPKP